MALSDQLKCLQSTLTESWDRLTLALVWQYGVATVGDSILRGDVPRDTDLNLNRQSVLPSRHMVLAQPSPSVLLRSAGGVRPAVAHWPPGGGEGRGGGQHCRGGGDVGLTENYRRMKY